MARIILPLTPAQRRRRRTVALGGVGLLIALGLGEVRGVHVYRNATGETQNTPSAQRELTLDVDRIARRGRTELELHKEIGRLAKEREVEREKINQKPTLENRIMTEGPSWWMDEYYAQHVEKIPRLFQEKDVFKDTRVRNEQRWSAVLKVLNYARPAEFVQVWVAVQKELTPEEIQRVKNEILPLRDQIKKYLEIRNVDIRKLSRELGFKEGALTSGYAAGLISLAVGIFYGARFIRRKRKQRKNRKLD